MDEPGGISIKKNITEPTVIKDSPGRLALVIQLGNQGGAFHDCTTVEAATAANMVWKIVTSGTGITSCQIPFENGIVLIPTVAVPPSQTSKFVVTYT